MNCFTLNVGAMDFKSASLSRIKKFNLGTGTLYILPSIEFAICRTFIDHYLFYDVESSLGRSLASDGVFLYCTNARGKGLAKIGSGLHGTLR